MGKLFVGFLLILLDFNLNFGDFTIGLIPDFIGCVILVNGFSELADESRIFGSLRSLGILLGIYSGLVYVLDLFGLGGHLGILSLLLGIVYTFLYLYISYRVILGIRDMERTYQADFNSKSLKDAWNVLAFCELAVYILGFFPVLGILTVIASMAASVLFLVFLNTAKKRYEEAKRI